MAAFLEHGRMAGRLGHTTAEQELSPPNVATWSRRAKLGMKEDGMKYDQVVENLSTNLLHYMFASAAIQTSQHTFYNV